MSVPFRTVFARNCTVISLVMQTHKDLFTPQFLQPSMKQLRHQEAKKRLPWPIGGSFPARQKSGVTASQGVGTCGKSVFRVTKNFLGFEVDGMAWGRIDIGEAIRQHEAGQTWREIAEEMNCTAHGIYKAIRACGLSCAFKPIRRKCSSGKVGRPKGADKPGIMKYCEKCNGPFQTRRTKQRFCSRSCASSAQPHPRKPYHCPGCGKPIRRRSVGSGLCIKCVNVRRRRQADSNGNLHCCRCGQMKPQDQFNREKKSNTGYKGACRMCEQAARRSAVKYKAGDIWRGVLVQCEDCGTEFARRQKTQRFCSDRCGRVAYHKRRRAKNRAERRKNAAE